VFGGVCLIYKTCGHFREVTKANFVANKENFKNKLLIGIFT